MPFWPICCESDAILFKKFRRGYQAGVFICENFHPGYQDIGRKNRYLGNRASPASHMNTSIFLQRKECRGEISETEPARLTAWKGVYLYTTLCVLFWGQKMVCCSNTPYLRVRAHMKRPAVVKASKVNRSIFVYIKRLQFFHRLPSNHLKTILK